MAAIDVPAAINPLPRTREVVERGKTMYETHCVMCHGLSGMGDGTVIGPFPKPPLLMSEKLVAYADSQIFHVITRGQNIMYPYGHKVRKEDRWAIVHYVRVLQRAYNPKPEDVDAYKKTVGDKKENQ
jgi:mono/diheme cytochrome c family protein